MINPAFATAFVAAQMIHALPQVQAFVALDAAAEWRGAVPFVTPAAAAMHRDPFLALWDKAEWREVYTDTDIGADFLTRFGHFELVGYDAPYRSTRMRGFIVYMPAGLYYDWHHHPAEEQYTVLAGEAEFQMAGQPPVTLRPGESVFHPSCVPHRTTTQGAPMLAWVAWRPPHMEIGPVLSGPQA